MSKRDKANAVERPDLTSVTRGMVSSASSTGEKTEDDVADEMDISMICDGCKKLIGGIVRLDFLACSHWFCFKCTPEHVESKKHVSCSRSSKAHPVFSRETSPIQMADHDGELSQDGMNTDKTKVNTTTPRGATSDGTRTARSRTPKKRESARKRKRRSTPKSGREQLWYFTYLTRPVVVSIPFEATFADLLNRLYLMLNLDQNTHQIRLKTQKSSSEHSEGEPEITAEPIPFEVPNPATPLAQLKIPRRKMLIVDVKKRKSSEIAAAKTPKKEGSKDEAKKPAIVEEQPSFSQSRAEEPRSM